ncbi:c-type cytochrome biogenesis protein CcmI [Plastorhodobacter daqingensis]|uniref:C-type cytochrome biogenesis protein CcmI n=1 Tax=Plastorhodobacter daqingensis TaxID=1387281 RepID=A0ABW2UGB2_9RHOB
MVFWIAAGGMALAVAALLVLALLRGRGADPAAAEYDLRVYRDQLREVDKDLARGVIGPEDAERLRLEVSRRILEADRAAARGALPAAQPPRVATLAALAVVVVAGATAFWTYSRIGAPGYPDLPLATRIAAAETWRATRPGQADAEAEAPAGAPFGEVDPQFLTLMEQLRSAMAERPLDLRGQELLARNEAALGNYVAARTAQAQVIALRGDDAGAEDYAALADLMVLAAGGYVSPEAETALTEALRRDPRNGTARYYSGLMFAQTGRPDIAFRMWRGLLEESAADAPWVPLVRAQIEEIAWRAGESYTLPPLDAARGPSLADIEAAADLPPEDREAMIRGMVQGLSDRLSTQGGSAEDWARLISAYGALGETGAAQAIWTEAQINFQHRPELLALIAEAAEAAGLPPAAALAAPEADAEPPVPAPEGLAQP